jgi:hypothetical protein
MRKELHFLNKFNTHIFTTIGLGAGEWLKLYSTCLASVWP